VDCCVSQQYYTLEFVLIFSSWRFWWISAAERYPGARRVQVLPISGISHHRSRRGDRPDLKSLLKNFTEIAHSFLFLAPEKLKKQKRRLMGNFVSACVYISGVFLSQFIRGGLSRIHAMCIALLSSLRPVPFLWDEIILGGGSRGYLAVNGGKFLHRGTSSSGSQESESSAARHSKSSLSTCVRWTRVLI